MALLSAFTGDTAKNLQLDSGILVANVSNPKSFTGDLNSLLSGGARLLGATSKGGKFSAEPKMRNIFDDIDGARGSVKNGNIIEDWDIKLSTTLKEMTVENLQMALAVADVTKATGNDKYDTIKPRNDVKESDYISNICWFGNKVGSDLPIIIEIKNAMNSKGIDLKFEDKSTGALEIEFKAHFDLVKPNEVPFNIFTPKKA